MRVFTACLCGVLVVSTAAIARADVSDYLGKPIATVRLTIEGRETHDPRLLPFVATQAGRPLSMVDVRESVLHLYSTGRFDDVRVLAGPVADGGVALHYELMPIHPVERVVITGSSQAPGVDEGRLHRVVVDRYGASPPVGRAQDIARLLEDQLRQRGYLSPVVTPRIALEHAPERATLTLSMQAGPRTHVGSVTVVGGPGVSEPELLRELALAPGIPYEPEVLAERIERYRAECRARGYFEARIVPTVRLAETERVANIALDAALGPRVRVAYAGDPIPSGQRDELVPIARESSTNEDVLEDASNNLQAYLRGQGYRDATVTHARTQTDDDLLITFTAKRGPQYRISSVEVGGSTAFSPQDLQSRLRLKAGDSFATSLLAADVELIDGLYRRMGFASVRVEPVIEPAPGAAGDAIQVPVTVRLQITEGPQTLVDSVSIEGNPTVSGEELRERLGLQAGRPFFLAQLALDRDAIQLQYANRGYPNATVETNPGVSADQRRADVVFRVREGPQILVDHVLVAGNTRTRSETIERELQLKSGEPLGLGDVIESQRRLAALGLFRRTRISQLAHGDETTRDVLVTVEESPATTIGYGGGVEAGQRIATGPATGVASERIEVAPRAFFEIGRRNLFGKNRSINLFTRISLRPDDTTDPRGNDDSGYGFSEYRVFGQFRESRVFGTAADAFLTATIEQQRRASFNFARRALTGEFTRRLTQQVGIGGSYQIQRTELFDVRAFDYEDRQLIDRLFPQLRLSSFSFSVVRDGRDDPLNPVEGQYLSANAQLAARAIGSEVGLAKSYLTAQMFRRLPGTGEIVLAASGRLGTAVGFPRDVARTDGSGNVVEGPAGRPVVDTVRALPASERFFAGGDTTVRGFAVDRLGTPETIDPNGFPLGGQAVLILNGELRVRVRGGFGVVGFLDVGNVFARTSDLNVADLRAAVGFGVRYRSPIGPIRIDLGFKVDPRELTPGVLEGPFAVHISLGQAF